MTLPDFLFPQFGRGVAETQARQNQRELEAEASRARVNAIHRIAQHFKRAHLQPTDRFREDLAADDIDRVEVMMELEELFDLDLSDSGVDDVATVGEAVEIVVGLARRKAVQQ